MDDPTDFEETTDDSFDPLGGSSAQLSEAEAREAVQAAIAESGASSMKDMGAVMKVLMAKYKGQIDGKAAQGLLKELLGS